jgi:CBS domain-containing protein
MHVEELMTREVRSCRSGDSLGAAAQLMWDADCGALPVVGDDGSRRVVGMITDRDICMAAHFRGLAPRAIAVADVMSKAVRTVAAGEALADAEAIMRDAQVRRLPVVDETQQLVGVISLADLAREAERRRRSKKPPLSEREVAETLSAIATPRRAVAQPASLQLSPS